MTKFHWYLISFNIFSGSYTGVVTESRGYGNKLITKLDINEAKISCASTAHRKPEELCVGSVSYLGKMSKYQFENKYEREL